MFLKPISKRKFDLLLSGFSILYFLIYSLIFYRGQRIEGFLMSSTGFYAFFLLSVALSLGPLAYLIPEWKSLVLHRRHLGVFTFFIAAFHGIFSTFMIAEGNILAIYTTYFGFSLNNIPFEIFGEVAVSILAVLATTSNNYFSARLGDKWKYIHLAVYFAFFFAVFHIATGPLLDEGKEFMYLAFYFVIGTVLLLIGFAIWKAAIRGARPLVEPGTDTGFLRESRPASKDKDQYLSRFIGSEESTSVTEPDVAPKPGKKIPIILDFAGDKIVNGDSSYTILENALDAGIEHTFECGGNARCSTCRVIILEGMENCLPRNQAEVILAKKKSFTDEVRLACQTHAVGNIKLRRLVLDEEDINEAMSEGVKFKASPGKELQLAVLFSDIRSFTPFTESNLPYDVVHMLNRYFNAIGKPIDENCGFIDKYMGDGIMVLFGLDQNRKTDPVEDGINAGLGILKALEEVNQYIKNHFNHEFRIGIGLHYGPVIVGEMGFHLKMQFTALGDTVNLASRIESRTKDAKTDFLISEEAYERVKDQPYNFGRKFKASIKGKTGVYTLHEILKPGVQ
ncbi:MAG: ferric reductase-like transmembrane domain-containing protein [Leptospira sp.]|nr:ferric reductase-like transmembrane domain-containing protein [Leptospira sp.]